MGSYQAAFVFLSFFVLICIRDSKGYVFSGVSAVFYFTGILYFPYLIEWDTQNFYRYYVWFLHELSWMGVIAYLGFKDKVYWRQSVLGQLLCLPILTMNFFRALDMSFSQFNFSLTPYQFIYPVFEIAIVALCWLPIFVYVKNKLFAKPQPV